jgi:hypothetical protein
MLIFQNYLELKNQGILLSPCSIHYTKQLKKLVIIKILKRDTDI